MLIKFDTLKNTIAVSPDSITKCIPSGEFTDIYFKDGTKETVTESMDSVMRKLKAGGKNMLLD